MATRRTDDVWHEPDVFDASPDASIDALINRRIDAFIARHIDRAIVSRIDVSRIERRIDAMLGDRGVLFG